MSGTQPFITVEKIKKRQHDDRQILPREKRLTHTFSIRQT